MSAEERANFYKKQVELENTIIETASKIVGGLKNPLIKDLIDSISIDSVKHKALLSALITLVSETTPFISEQVSDEIKASIKKHIELEAEAINTYKSMLDQLKDSREKMIVEAIYNDELRHHTLLQKIYNTIVKNETLDGDSIWELYTAEVMPQY